MPTKLGDLSYGSTLRRFLLTVQFMQNKIDSYLFFRIHINLLNNVWIEKVTISLLLVYGSRFHDTVLIMLCLEAFFRQICLPPFLPARAARRIDGKSQYIYSRIVSSQQIFIKGQTISKANYGVLNSSKMNETHYSEQKRSLRL